MVFLSAELGDALILILGLMGGLILLLGVFLVVHTINALLAQQVRQIGMMKAIGGQQRQIAAVYLVVVLAYGLLAAGRYPDHVVPFRRSWGSLSRRLLAVAE